MTAIIDVVARAIANKERRAVLVRETSEILPDPSRVFGIAPVKMVSEELVQAIAFGPMDRPPQIVVRWNPLSRDAGDLDPFAEALDGYLTSMLSSGLLPRVWLPYKSALTLVDLLGHRYRRNKNATDRLRRMGAQCRVLADEAEHPGQQVVAVATGLLTTHVVTGQTPIKDRHLGALLAWVDPEEGKDPEQEADEKAFVPAAAMLRREDDDEVERLRKIVKAGGRDAPDAKSRLERILRDGARAEWKLLVRARRAYWRLGLEACPNVSKLAAESMQRMSRALELDFAGNPPSNPDTLARLLDEREYSAQLVEDAAFRGDRRIRERARYAGRAVLAEVVAVDQQRRSRKPCTLTLKTAQEVLRVRAGTRLRTPDAAVAGRVVDERLDPVTGERLIVLRLTKGVQRSVRPAVGSTYDWVDTAPFDGRYVKSKAYKILRERAPALAYGDELPPSSPRKLPRKDLAEVVARLRIK